MYALVILKCTHKYKLCYHFHYFTKNLLYFPKRILSQGEKFSLKIYLTNWCLNLSFFVSIISPKLFETIWDNITCCDQKITKVHPYSNRQFMPKMSVYIMCMIHNFFQNPDKVKTHQPLQHWSLQTKVSHNKNHHNMIRCICYLINYYIR